jgi:hypothetical protein
MSALFMIPLIGVVAILKKCCTRPLSENSRRLRSFYRAFLEENYNKPPEFYSASDLQYFFDFYAEDVRGMQNPVQTDWWPSVTQKDIDEAFPTRIAMHTYLSNSLI